MASFDDLRFRASVALKRSLTSPVQWTWERVTEIGSIGPHSARGRRFARFGEGSIICFPWITLFNEHAIEIGTGTMIGPQVALSAGMAPGQELMSSSIVRIGDRCLIGKGSGIVGHWSIDIGDDVWTGHHIYLTDQNHGYEDVTRPISEQSMSEQAVRIGDGSWLGHGTIVLPGANIGKHVVVGAGSVVTGVLPDFSVCAGSPARPLRVYDPDVERWERPI